MTNVIRSTNQKGYTLAELAISTSILAMLAVGGLSIMGKKNEADNLKETYMKLEKIEAALESFIRVNRRVPCPAGPQLSSDNSTNNSHQYFGYEVAYNDAQADGDDSDFQECDNDAADDGNGDSDLNDDGVMNANDLLENATGAVPVRTLGLPDDYMYDGWDRKFTYRIARGAGHEDHFDISSFHGDIGIMDRKGIHKTDINNLPPNNNGAIYVIISHGSNGKGVAWGKNASIAPTPASGVEGQNTNHASKNYIQSPKTDTFDDIVEFGLKKDVLRPFNVTSPVDVSPLTCENATELVEKGRATLNTLAGNTSATLADQIFNNALLLSELCDSAPTEIKVPSSFRGLVLWLDADDINTVHELSTCNDTAENGDEVQCWLDKSDNGNNAISTTGPDYDIYDPIGDTGGMNNRNVLVANDDAGADFLRIAENPNNPSLDSIQNNTFFFVGQVDSVPTSPSASSILSKVQNPGTKHFQYGLSSFTGQLFIDNSSTLSSNSQVPISRPVLYSWRVNLGQNVSYYMDGEELTQSSGAVLGSLVLNDEDVYLFSSNPGSAELLDAKIGEIVLYNTTLSNQERSSLEVYLSDKWSIDLNNTNSELCPPGMEFIRNQERPEGACQCVTDNNVLVQELSSVSACLFGQNKFNTCASINSASPSYTNPPSSSGQVLWLDANDCTTITLDGSLGQVTLWKDKSANEFNAEQTTTSRMPLYNQNSINGLDTIDFDGINDHLTLGNNYIYSANDGLNIFAVADSSKSSSTAKGYIVDFGNAQTAGYGLSFIENAIDPYATGADHMNKTDLFTPSYAILHMNVDFTNQLVIKINGTELKEEKKDATATTALDNAQISQASTRGGGQGPVTIGAQSSTTSDSDKFHDGNIGELIIYDKKLTTNEALAVENYLSDKWAINNSPDDIASLELWLDASDTSTVFEDACGGTKANSADSVACWEDKSSNTNNAVASGSNRPTFAILTADGAFTINVIDGGLPDETMPVLNFNSASFQRMTIPNHSTLDRDSDLSLFVLYDTAASDAGDHYIFTKFTNASNHQYGIYYTNAGGKRMRFTHKIGGVTVETTADSPAGSGNALRLYSGTVSSTGAVKSYFQGAQSGAGTNYKTASYTTGATGGGQLVIGDSDTVNGSEFNGQMAEIMFFSDELSDSEREYIEQYLSSKWGVTINQN